MCPNTTERLFGDFQRTPHNLDASDDDDELKGMRCAVLYTDRVGVKAYLRPPPSQTHTQRIKNSRTTREERSEGNIIAMLMFELGEYLISFSHERNR